MSARAGLAFALAWVLVACAAPAPAPPSEFARRPITQPDNKRGVHLLLDDARHPWPLDVWPDHLALAHEAVGEWGYVVELVRADDLDPARWQVFMDLCAELHLTPIIRLAPTYNLELSYWNAPQRDADGTYRTLARRYAEFVTALDWPTPEHVVIVGNEPNHGDEWGGRPDSAAYARFLVDVADALHSADPQARVLNAGLDPYTPHTGDTPFADGLHYMDAETFMDEMRAAQPGVFERLDAWASHAYTPGFAAPPWEQSYGVDWLNGAKNPAHVAPSQGIANRGVNGYEWELWKLSTYGLAPLPVFITETGWRHAESALPSRDGTSAYPGAETVAQYLDLAMWGNGGRYPGLPSEGWLAWQDDPRVVMVAPFAFDGRPEIWGHTNWLVLDERGRVTDSYAMLETWAQGQPVLPPEVRRHSAVLSSTSSQPGHHSQGWFSAAGASSRKTMSSVPCSRQRTITACGE